MNKRSSLKHISAFIGDQIKLTSLIFLLNGYEEDEKLTRIQELGPLAFYQAEIAMHRDRLKKAIKICGRNLGGAQSLVAEVLNKQLGLAFSKPLLKFIEMLPGAADQQARAMTKESDWERHQQNLVGHLHNIELTNFASSYADDLAEAKRLAESGGDIDIIRDLLS